VVGVPILGIVGVPTWESWEKWHLGVAPMVSHKEYYKGEGGGFPQVQAMVSLMSPCVHMVHLCTKNASITH
jgi:hypothetical protein